MYKGCCSNCVCCKYDSNALGYCGNPDCSHYRQNVVDDSGDKYMFCSGFISHGYTLDEMRSIKHKYMSGLKNR